MESNGQEQHFLERLLLKNKRDCNAKFEKFIIAVVQSGHVSF